MDGKSKFLLLFAINFIGLGLLLIVQSQNSGKLRLIACNIGQGDGMLIVTPVGKQIIVDGGPGNKIIDCLSGHMPFWDRKIEMILLTHPQKDHMEGFVDVLKKYEVEMVVTTGLAQESDTFRAFQEGVSIENSQNYNAKAGDRLILDSYKGKTLSLNILWPSVQMLESWKVNPPSDLNDSSIVTRLEYGDFCAYLTGDIPKETLETLIDKQCQVLKIAHHGSKTGTNQAILDSIDPQVAIIQVGKNSYGHPHGEILNLLRSKGVKTLRNDTEGIIEIESDGRSYRLN